jgi:8-oxoguanine deaminase
MRTLLRARWILVYQENDHRILVDGEVLVDGHVVSAVGRRGRVAVTGEVDETIDLGDSLLMPGLIDLDAVSDIDHAILDSWQDPAGAARLQWSEDYAKGGPRHTLSLDQRRTMRRFALAELLMHGVTTAVPIASEVHSDWAESFEDAVVIAGEAEDLGLRVFVGPSYRSGVPVTTRDGRSDVYWDPARGEHGLHDAERFLRWIDGNTGDLVSGILLPCRIETMTEDLLRRTAEVSQRSGVPVRIHALQGLTELRMVQARGTNSLELLERTGLLGRDLIVAHGIYVNGHPGVSPAEPSAPRGGGDVRTLAENGVTVVHCPLTSARYGHALHDIDAYERAGVNIALGTDSFPPDMLRGIDTGSSVAKIVTGRLEAGAHATFVRAATTGGAAALRRPDLGRISPGVRADLVAVRLDDVRDGVIDDPVRSAVNHSSARSVDFVMTEGIIRVRDGDLVGVDLRKLRSEAQDILELLKGGYTRRTAEPSSCGELFPPTFPAYRCDE